MSLDDMGGVEMSDLRSRFEETEVFKKFHHKDMGFSKDKNCYTSAESGLLIEVIALQGAWEMFQELNKWVILINFGKKKHVE